MPTAFNTLIFGASYGSLLATKLVLGFQGLTDAERETIMGGAARALLKMD